MQNTEEPKPSPGYGFTLAKILYGPTFRMMRFFGGKRPLGGKWMTMSESAICNVFDRPLLEMGCGFEFDASTDAWVTCVPRRPEKEGFGGDLLRIATLNVEDAPTIMDFLLAPELRYKFQVETLIPALNADIFCFNEVTAKWLNRALASEFVRSHYYVSRVEGTPESGFQVGSGQFGNVIFSRLPFSRVVNSSRIRGVHAEVDCGGDGLVISSVHWMAQEDLHHVRKVQIDITMRQVEEAFGQLPVVMLGDWNLHGTVINEDHLIQPYCDLWRELRGAEEGITWDSLNNGLTAALFVGDGRRMRLDRVALSNKPGRPGLQPLSIDIFATENIYPGDPYYGYLTASDHYGLVASFQPRLVLPSNL